MQNLADYVLNVTDDDWLKKNVGFTEERLDKTEIQNVDLCAWNILRNRRYFIAFLETRMRSSQVVQRHPTKGRRTKYWSGEA